MPVGKTSVLWWEAKTSIQPAVIDAGLYVLTATIVGIGTKSAIIDGSAIREGDCACSGFQRPLHQRIFSGAAPDGEMAADQAGKGGWDDVYRTDYEASQTVL